MGSKLEIDDYERDKRPLPGGRAGDRRVSTGVASGDSPIRRPTAEGIVAEVRLEHPDLLLGPTLRRTPDATVEPEYRTTIDDGRTVVFCRVSAPAYEAFEDGLAADPTVRDPVLIDCYPDRRVYRLELTERTITYVGKTAELGGRVLDVASGRDGWVVRLRLPEREDLVSFNDFCKENEISFQVNHLRTAEDEAPALIGLTPKQQELLSVAFEEGYFDVPRGISQDELADRLGVSKSAVSQRLRRAIARLCDASLA